MIKQYKTILDYWMDSRSFLIQQPVKHNIIIGQCLGHPSPKILPQNGILLNVYHENNIVLSCFKNRDFLLLVGELYPSSQVQELSDYLQKIQLPISGVIAEKELAIAFAQSFSKQFFIRKKLIAHQLFHLNDIALSEGKMRLCTLEEIDFVSNWLYQFQVECDLNLQLPPEKIKEDTIARINRGMIYLWVVDNNPVSVCADAQSNEYFSKISLVYTPEKYRRKNYARSCVWSLAKHIQARGQQTICLFTDAANPTSNKIYKEIGFQKINEDCEIEFNS